MSTIKIHQLREQERQALAMSLQALYHLVHVRGEQVVAHQQLQEDWRNDTAEAENRTEELCAMLDEISGRHGLDVMLPAKAQLARLDAELLSRKNEIRELRRYSKLIQLCLNGACSGMDPRLFAIDAEKAIVAEVQRLKAEEVPF